jgi:exosortase/archaeosortase family protein
VPPSTDPSPPRVSAGARAARWFAAALLLLAGASLIAWAGQWRGMEATLAGHSIQLVTNQTTIAVPARHMLILYAGTSVQSVFILTSECSVAYLLAAFLIASAPLMLLHKLSPRRTALAIAVTTTILIVVNIARLTAIGATVSTVGSDPGFQIAHTYLGSLLTILGACLAGVAFAAILVVHRKPRAVAMS